MINVIAILNRIIENIQNLGKVTNRRSRIIENTRNLGKVTNRRSPITDEPLILHLHAINQIWHIKRIQTQHVNIRYLITLGIEYNTLTIYGNVRNKQRVQLLVHKWLKEMASTHFTPWIQRLSFEFKLPFNKVTFRAQKTLWGSCNSNKNISLNYKLLFLPPEFAQHVMLHELCHTKHLNHSARFWNLLASVDPNYKEHDRALRKNYVNYTLLSVVQ